MARVATVTFLSSFSANQKRQFNRLVRQTVSLVTAYLCCFWSVGSVGASTAYSHELAGEWLARMGRRS